MNLLILALLMAFGGQTETPQHVQLNPPIELLSNSELVANVSFVECSDGMTMTVVGGIVARCVNRRWIKEPCDDVKRPEISLHPYPLWRMEAQPMRFGHTFSTGVNEPFEAEYGIEHISQDGPRWIIDWPVVRRLPDSPIDVPAVQERGKDDCNWVNSDLGGFVTTTHGATGIAKYVIKKGPMLDNGFGLIEQHPECTASPQKDGVKRWWISYGPGIDTLYLHDEPGGHTFTVFCDRPLAFSCKKTFLWSCADKSRSLESSVDGLKHWCHRMTD